MDAAQLRAFYDRDTAAVIADPDYFDAHERLLSLLETGELRAASPDGQGGWAVNTWVKQAILAAFRAFPLEALEGPGWPFFDKRAFPVRHFTLADGVRIVPGGTAVRRGAFVAKGAMVIPRHVRELRSWHAVA